MFVCQKKSYLCLVNRGPLSIPQIVISDSHFNEVSSPQKSNTFTLKQLKFECVLKTLYNFIKFVNETTHQRGVRCVIRRSLLGECCAEAPQGAWKKRKLSIYCHKIGCGDWGCTLPTRKLSLHQRVVIRNCNLHVSLNFLIPCRSRVFFPIIVSLSKLHFLFSSYGTDIYCT